MQSSIWESLDSVRYGTLRTKDPQPWEDSVRYGTLRTKSGRHILVVFSEIIDIIVSSWKLAVNSQTHTVSPRWSTSLWCGDWMFSVCAVIETHTVSPCRSTSLWCGDWMFSVCSGSLYWIECVTGYALLVRLKVMHVMWNLILLTHIVWCVNQPPGAGNRLPQALCVVSQLCETSLCDQLLSATENRLRTVGVESAHELLRTAYNSVCPQPNHELNIRTVVRFLSDFVVSIYSLCIVFPAWCYTEHSI